MLASEGQRRRWPSYTLALVLIPVIAVAVVLVAAWQRAGAPVTLPGPPGAQPVARGADDTPIAAEATQDLADLKRGYGTAGVREYALPGADWAGLRSRYGGLVSGWRRSGPCTGESAPGTYRCRWVETGTVWPRAIELVLLRPPAVGRYPVLLVFASRGR